MRLTLPGIAAVALSLLLAPASLATPASEHSAKNTAKTSAKHAAKHHKRVVHKKRAVRRHYRWRGYGFLPGYVPPEVAARRREREYRESHPFYGPAWPRFYHGRWNGGGFGPCYVSTPIGYMWTCD